MIEQQDPQKSKPEKKVQHCAPRNGWDRGDCIHAAHRDDGSPFLLLNHLLRCCLARQERALQVAARQEGWCTGTCSTISASTTAGPQGTAGLGKPHFRQQQAAAVAIAKTSSSHFDHSIKIVFAHLQEGHRFHNAGIANRDIQTAKAAHSLGHRRLHLWCGSGHTKIKREGEFCGGSADSALGKKSLTFPLRRKLPHSPPAACWTHRRRWRPPRCLPPSAAAPPSGCPRHRCRTPAPWHPPALATGRRLARCLRQQPRPKWQRSGGGGSRRAIGACRSRDLTLGCACDQCYLAREACHA